MPLLAILGRSHYVFGFCVRPSVCPSVGEAGNKRHRIKSLTQHAKMILIRGRSITFQYEITPKSATWRINI